MDAGERERLDALAVDVDTRLVEIWLVALGPSAALTEALEGDERLAAEVGAAVRAAYARGYCDALQEDRAGRRAALHKAHGYQPE